VPQLALYLYTERGESLHPRLLLMFLVVFGIGVFLVVS
jgi:hypothetical protein